MARYKTNSQVKIIEQDKKEETIKSEFNMSIATLERIHKLFSYINEAPHHPIYSQFFTPEKKADAYLSTYEEVYPLIDEAERKIFKETIIEILECQRQLILSKAAEGRISELKVIKTSARLNILLMEFGKNLRVALQRHDLLFKSKRDLSNIILD